MGGGSSELRLEFLVFVLLGSEDGFLKTLLLNVLLFSCLKWENVIPILAFPYAIPLQVVPSIETLNRQKHLEKKKVTFMISRCTHIKPLISPQFSGDYEKGYVMGVFETDIQYQSTDSFSFSFPFSLRLYPSHPFLPFPPAFLPYSPTSSLPPPPFSPPRLLTKPHISPHF